MKYIFSIGLFFSICLPPFSYQFAQSRVIWSKTANRSEWRMGKQMMNLEQSPATMYVIKWWCLGRIEQQYLVLGVGIPGKSGDWVRPPAGTW